MSAKRRIILVVLLFGLLSSLLFAQEAILLEVNDNNLRLRANPGLDGKILTLLQKGEILEYKYVVPYGDISDGEYQWVHIKTANGMEGWVFGEFVDVLNRKAFTFKFIEDAGININGKTILSGMTKDVLIAVLGEPQRISDDKEYYEYSFSYGDDESLVFLVHRYNNRIHHIIVESSDYMLSNGIKIGMNISKISNLADVGYTRKNSYLFSLRNITQSESYETSIIIDTNSEGVIQSMQIGLPEP